MSRSPLPFVCIKNCSIWWNERVLARVQRRRGQRRAALRALQRAGGPGGRGCACDLCLIPHGHALCEKSSAFGETSASLLASCDDEAAAVQLSGLYNELAG